MGRVGIEHPPLAISKTAISVTGGAKSGAHDAPKKFQNSDLAQITAAWPALPEHIKMAILIMVKGAGK
jgi:hypothetical protein